MRASRLVLLPALVIASLAAASDPFSPDGPRRDNSVRSISGEVRFASGAPASGAVVKLKDLKTLAIRSYLVAGDGKFSFQNLSSNVDYQVRADAPGFAPATKTISIFDSRPHVVVKLKLEPAKK